MLLLLLLLCFLFLFYISSSSLLGRTVWNCPRKKTWRWGEEIIGGWRAASVSENNPQAVNWSCATNYRRLRAGPISLFLAFFLLLFSLSIFFFGSQIGPQSSEGYRADWNQRPEQRSITLSPRREHLDHSVNLREKIFFIFFPQLLRFRRSSFLFSLPSPWKTFIHDLEYLFEYLLGRNWCFHSQTGNHPLWR